MIDARPRFYSHYDAPMWTSIAEGAMHLQQCSHCSRWRYPPGPTCPDCLSTEFVWKPIAGKGKLLSWATFHRQYLPAYPTPHTVIAVQLTEGPLMVSHIAQDQLSRVVVDAPVKIRYVIHPEGYPIHTFDLT